MATEPTISELNLRYACALTSTLPPQTEEDEEQVVCHVSPTAEEMAPVGITGMLPDVAAMTYGASVTEVCLFEVLGRVYFTH